MSLVVLENIVYNAAQEGGPAKKEALHCDPVRSGRSVGKKVFLLPSSWLSKAAVCEQEGRTVRSMVWVAGHPSICTPAVHSVARTTATAAEMPEAKGVGTAACSAESAGCKTQSDAAVRTEMQMAVDAAATVSAAFC